MLLAEKLSGNSEVRGEAFNFSNEIQVNVLELTRKILSLMNSDLQPEILNQATNEIRHQYLSAGKAKQMLGWKPLFTLEEGLARTINWYQDFFASGGDREPHVSTQEMFS